MFEIRSARPDDYPALLHLWRQGWHDAHAELVPSAVLKFRTPADFGVWLGECSDQFYVAEDETSLLGFMSVKADELVKLYIGRQKRGTGVAHDLLAYAENHISAMGFEKACLFCTAGNLRAQRFYEREGWRLAATAEDRLWFPAGEKSGLMVLTHRYEKSFARTVVEQCRQ
jgi:GNAT superfamily N-acetyltransferase